MKIAHVVSTYPPYQGGMGNVAQAMHEALLPRGHASVVFTPEYQAISAESTIVRLKPWLRFGNAAWIPQVYRHLREFDIIHLHYPFYGGAEAPALFKRLHPKARMVITYHMDTLGSGIVSTVSTLYNFFIRGAILRTGDVVTVSSRDYVDHSALAKYASLPVVELPFGVDPVFRPKLEAKHHGQDLQVLFVGGLDKAHYFKGLSVLLQAIAACRHPVRLSIVGSGDLQTQYQQQANQLGLADKVKFLGKLPRPALVEAYQGSDVTILPSIDRSEAFGLVLLESMACQTAVIASNLPGVRTLARQGTTGLVVPPGDFQALSSAIDSLASDRKQLAKFSQQASAVVEQEYRWPKIIDRLEALYRGSL